MLELRKIFFKYLVIEGPIHELDFQWDRVRPDNSFEMSLSSRLIPAEKNERYILIININFEVFDSFKNEDSLKNIFNSLITFSNSDVNFKKIIRDINNNKALICFTTMEPSNFYYEPYSKLFKQFVNKIGIQQSKTFFMVPDFPHVDFVKNGFNLIHFPGHMPYGLSGYDDVEKFYSFYKFYLDKSRFMYRDKYFISLNNGVRLMRSKLFQIVDENNLYNKFYFSYLFTANIKADDYFSTLSNHLRVFNRNIDDNKIKYLCEKLPIKLDIEEIQSSNITEGYIHPGYFNSYLNIVTECSIENDWTYFSEKTFKPIIACQPFIMLAGQNHLKALQRCGYKTFHPYINENYDNEPEKNIRMKMIEEEILRISSFSKKEIHEWYWAMKDILVHNLNNFRQEIMYNGNLRYSKIEKLWNT